MSDLQRDKFEAWAKSKDINTVKYGATGVYCYPDAHAAWIVWQAAIESVVVELPCWSEYDTPRQAIDACAERIEAAGVIVNDRP